MVPYSVLVDAHHILHLDYGFSSAEATYVLTNFADARRVHWYAGPDDPDIREGLDLAGEHNIDGWDGYYAHVARTTGATTVVGIDDDFGCVAGLSAEVPLTGDEREQLHEYLAPEPRPTLMPNSSTRFAYSRRTRQSVALPSSERAGRNHD